jgi:NDP-sugar pyrophosphorylase family protein
MYPASEPSSPPGATAGIDTAVVLAGGEGRRLRPLTRYRPKPLLPGGTRPILDHVLDTALNAGVTLSTGATTAPGETVLEDR